MLNVFQSCKCSKKLITISCVISCVIIFSIIIVSIVIERNRWYDFRNCKDEVQIGNEMKPYYHNNYKRAADDNKCRFLTNDNRCQLVCVEDIEKNIRKFLLNFMQTKDPCRSTITLSLSGCLYSNNMISKLWLNNVENITVDKLIITGGSIADIEGEAFNTIIFSQTRVLELSGTNIDYFKSDMLIGLNGLTKLFITNAKFIDSHFLEPVKGLTFIKVQNWNNNDNTEIVNLTGSINLPYLEIAELSVNYFRNTIKRRSFVGLNSVISLYLSNSRIEVIGRHSFDALNNTIKLLDLRINLLKTLPPNLFDKLLSKRTMKIWLSKNDWQCDCKLKQLQSQVMTYPQHFYDFIICNSGSSANEKINATTFCETDLETTTYIENNAIVFDSFIKVYCSSLVNNTLNDDYDDDDDDDNDERYLTINSGNAQDIKIIEHSNNSLIVKIKKLTENLKFLWYTYNSTAIVAENILIKDQMYCYKNLSPTFLVENLIGNSVYLFCLTDQSTLISPLDCVPHFVKSDDFYHQDKYNLNDTRNLVFGLMITTIALSIFLGLFIGICILIRNPKRFLRTRNINANNNNNNINNNNNNNNINNNNNNSINHNNDDRISADLMFAGRELNEQPNYESIKYKRSLNRSVSDSSISGKSYITAVIPSPFQIIQWRMEKMREKNTENAVYLDKLSSDNPPPLPPHPKRKKIEQPKSDCNVECFLNNNCTCNASSSLL